MTFTEPDPACLPARPPATQRSSAPLRLSPPGTLDRQARDIVRLSRRDGLSSLRQPGAFGRMVARTLGLERANPLADPRLERLRRFAVLLRHAGARLRAREEARMIEAGFTHAQIAEVRHLVARERPSAPTERGTARRAALLCLLIGVQIVLFRLASAYFNDGLLGLIATFVALISATSLVNAFRSVHLPRRWVAG